MNVYTVHEAPDAAPVLVPEGFSWAALVFGWLWLALHGALLAALALFVLLLVLSHAPPGLRIPLVVGLTVAQGVFGRDLWRLSLHWRGYVETTAIAAASHDAALLRLADQSLPDLRTPDLQTPDRSARSP